jgi:hypothetical protein
MRYHFPRRQQRYTTAASRVVDRAVLRSPPEVTFDPDIFPTLAPDVSPSLAPDISPATEEGPAPTERPPPAGGVKSRLHNGGVRNIGPQVTSKYWQRALNAQRPPPAIARRLQDSVNLPPATNARASANRIPRISAA